MPLPTPPATPTAALIRGWRHAARLPQTALAARLQVSQARLSAWETGANGIDPVHMARIAAACHVDPTEAGRGLLSLAGVAA